MDITQRYIDEFERVRDSSSRYQFDEKDSLGSGEYGYYFSCMVSVCRTVIYGTDTKTGERVAIKKHKMVDQERYGVVFLIER